MILRRHILLLILLFWGGFMAAQDIDSLKKAAYSGPDTSRVDALTLLAKYLSSDDPQKALFYANEAYKGADDLDDERRKAWALNYMGSVYYYKGNYDSSFYYHKQSLDIRLTINDPKGLGASYNNIGLIYDDQGKSKDALDYYLKAITEFEKAHFTMGVAIANGSIGNLYYYQEDYTSAEKYFDFALKANLDAGDQRGIMNNYNNLALVYESKGDTIKALDYLNKAMIIANREGYVSMMVTGLNNMGEIYSAQMKLDIAMPLFRRSIAICDSVEEESRKISPILNVGYCFLKTGQNDSALVYANEGLRLARTSGWLSSVMEAYRLIARVYFASNDFANAYDARIHYEEVKDSVFNEKQSAQLTEMQTKYDTERITKDNLLKDERLQSQARQRGFIIGGAILIAIVALIILFAWRKTRKLNMRLNEQKVEILEKNADLSRKNDMIEEQKHEITSSIEYASRIQSAMLPAASDFSELFPSSFVYYKPRDIVSGDFYFIAGDKKQAVIAVADCTGHGVPGAMMSMIGVEKLGQAVARYENPGEMLGHLNRAVKSSMSRAGQEQIHDGMDILLCQINFETMRMKSAAANRPLLLIRNGILLEYKPTKTAIGGITPNDQVFRDENILLESGDMIYLFSDGFADQFGGPDGKKFMSRRFRDLLSSMDQLPLEDQLIGLGKAFDDWKGNLNQVDDVLVIGIRV